MAVYSQNFPENIFSGDLNQLLDVFYFQQTVAAETKNFRFPLRILAVFRKYLFSDFIYLAITTGERLTAVLEKAEFQLPADFTVGPPALTLTRVRLGIVPLEK